MYYIFIKSTFKQTERADFYDQKSTKERAHFLAILVILINLKYEKF